MISAEAKEKLNLQTINRSRAAWIGFLINTPKITSFLVPELLGFGCSSQSANANEWPFGSFIS